MNSAWGWREGTPCLESFSCLGKVINSGLMLYVLIEARYPAHSYYYFFVSFWRHLSPLPLSFYKANLSISVKVAWWHLGASFLAFEWNSNHKEGLVRDSDCSPCQDFPWWGTAVVICLKNKIEQFLDNCFISMTKWRKTCNSLPWQPEDAQEYSCFSFHLF